MALILPTFRFARFVDNATTTATVAPVEDTGVQSNTTGSANVDTTPVTLLSALAFDVHLLEVAFHQEGGAVDCNGLVDILIDPAGGTSWAELISDIALSYHPYATVSSGLTYWLRFPLFIRAGSSLGVRHRAATGSLDFCAVARCHGEPSRPELWWCGQKVETLGAAQPSASKGTNVTPGNSNAWGSWTDIGASTRRYGALALGINGTDASTLNTQYFFQIGAGGAQLPGTPQYMVAAGGAGAMQYITPAVPVWCDEPSGTTFQVRGMCAGTAETFNFTLHGVY